MHIPPPIFRSLKTIKKPNEVIYHFVNDGGAILNINTISSNEIKISFNANKIESNESGYIKFELLNNYNENEFKFELTYYDKITQFYKVEYLYSIVGNKLSVKE